MALARRDAHRDGRAELGRPQVGLPLQLRRARLRRLLPQPLEGGAQQQEGRRDVAQRRGRQRDPRGAGTGAHSGGLHDRRSGRLPGRHDGLHLADHDVQGRELRDLQHLPDPAGLHDVLASGGPAGPDQADQDRPDRQDGAVRLAGRRGRIARLQPRQRRVLGADLALQVLADGDHQRGARRPATARRPTATPTSSSARAWRCWMSPPPR